jgi:two-component system chemotaxis response regulator CheY
MPNMDGIELIRRLRALPQFKFVPIVLLTTDSQPEKKQEGKAAGATGWIVKPFQPDQLLDVVHKVIR